jgi:hypothetical protein
LINSYFGFAKKSQCLEPVINPLCETKSQICEADRILGKRESSIKKKESIREEYRFQEHLKTVLIGFGPKRPAGAACSACSQLHHSTGMVFR